MQDHWTSLSPTFLRAIGRDSPPWDDGTAAAAGAGATPSPAAVAAVRTRIAKLARDRHPAAVRFVQNLFSALDWSVTEATVCLRAGATATAAGRPSGFSSSQRRRLLVFFSIAVTCAQLMAFLVSDVPSLFLQGPPVLADRLSEMLAFLIVHAPVDASSDEYAALVQSAGSVDRTNNPFLHPLALARPLVAMLGSLWTRERGKRGRQSGSGTAVVPAIVLEETSTEATGPAVEVAGADIDAAAAAAASDSLPEGEEEEAVDEPGTPAQEATDMSMSDTATAPAPAAAAANDAPFDTEMFFSSSSLAVLGASGGNDATSTMSPLSATPVATTPVATAPTAAGAASTSGATPLPPGATPARVVVTGVAGGVDFILEQSVVDRLCAMPAACPNEHLDQLRSAVFNADDVLEGSTEGNEQLREHCRAVGEMVEDFVARRAGGDLMEADVPEDFMDPITMACMVDPVRLPDSRVVLDRSTIERHLEESSVDPYSRTPLEAAALEPLQELKKQIEEWRKALAAKPVKEASTSLDGTRAGASSHGEGSLPAANRHTIVSHVPESWDVDSDHDDDVE